MVETVLEVKKYRGEFIKPGRHYLEGSEACVEGALLAGMKVYAGYPITPASEIWTTLRFLFLDNYKEVS